MPKGGTKRQPPSDPDKFEEAVAAWRRRVPMTDDDFAALDAAEQDYAFTVANVSGADVVQQIFDAIDSAVEKGTTLEDFKRDIGPQLNRAWGGPNSWRTETVFRTNVLSAYNQGRHTIMTAPVVKRARPFWRFDAVMDSRTSPICEELDGAVRPADDPFWRKHTPPLHHACRSILTPLTDEEAQDEGVSGELDPESAPTPGFGKAPPEEGSDWTPDVRRFDPAIAEVLKGRLK